ncbi:hypothetical protein JCM14202_3953 [Agrilactobacillus composti DSM 18527 = JCM 14202]|nr:hypothetical protein [Agrilactobacillus composti]GAF41976.1 hypothetical protein JCM14202_3953 [Agrilactobacillus composti DSM 18527 = JCM 14202]
MSESRYYQPKDSKDAMRYVEGLFNQYSDAPLTDAILQYNQKLMRYLQQDVAQEALREGQPNRQKTALQMADIMGQWQRARLLGKPFIGKMKGFKIKRNSHTRYHVDQGRRKNRQPTMRKTMHK